MAEFQPHPDTLPEEYANDVRTMVVQSCVATGAPLEKAYEVAAVVIKAVGLARKAMWDTLGQTEDMKVRIAATPMVFTIAAQTFESDTKAAIAHAQSIGAEPVYFVFDRNDLHDPRN